MNGQSEIEILAACMAAIAAISAVVGATISLPPRGWQQLPWPERARHVSVARFASLVTIFAIGIPLPYIASIYVVTAGIFVPAWYILAIQLFSMLGPMVLAIWIFWLTSSRRRPLGDWIAGFLSALIVRFPALVVYGLVVVAMFVFGHDMYTMFVLFILGALGICLSVWGAGIWCAYALGLARPALPRVTNAADWAGERIGVRASHVFEVQWPRVAILQFPFSKYLFVSSAAAELLSDEELVAIFIRELSFFHQRWLEGALRVVSACLFFLMLAGVAFSINGNPRMMFYIIFAIYVILFLLRPFRRRTHRIADSMAAQSGIDRVSSLKELERVHELNVSPVVALFKGSANPHLYDRMVGAGILPLYPRPKPPSKVRAFLSVAAALGVFVFLSLLFLVEGPLFLR
jgi:hypothetical protein